MYLRVCTTWNQDIFNVDKLRTCVTFKQEYGTEHYVKVVTNRVHKVALSQFRCGVLHLKVETGRFQDIPVEYRLCTMCDENVIVLESHFLLYCSKYNQLIYPFFSLNNLFTLYPNFDYSDDGFKLTVLISNEYVKSTAKFIWGYFNIRRRNMYIMV